ncbi:hypothetical protein GCM10017744_100840 [Streptomyces antimycoticus]
MGKILPHPARSRGWKANTFGQIARDLPSRSAECERDRSMDTTTVAAFLAVDLLLVFTPGADWAYAIAAGCGTVRSSRRSPG